MAERDPARKRDKPPAAVEPSAGSVKLSFPDGPRLELDQLLQQLVARAQEVMATQGRLRGLLRANQLVTGDLALPVVLHRIAEAARELVGARYAALGVIGPEGGLVEFVHDGMSPEQVELIGDLPAGKGLLGALIDDPRPIRLRRIADDGRSAGFPAHHPPMTSFLGVPIRLGTEIFGNLYLTESTRGEFSTEDEELARALATTAGVAIQNSRLYEAARLRGEWLEASAAIARQLVADDEAGADDALRLIAESGRRIAEADMATVVLPLPGDDPSRLRVEVAIGPSSAGLAGMTVPVDGSLSGRVFRTGEPMRLSAPDGPDVAVPPSGWDALDVGPLLMLPLHGSDRVRGVLNVIRRRGRPGFTAEDLAMAGVFANHAAVAIELAESRAERQRASRLDDRDRIAADLHDHVIQRLFAAGLTLNSVATGLPPGRPTERILATVDDLDQTIRQIRTAIYELGQAPPPPAGSGGSCSVWSSISPRTPVSTKRSGSAPYPRTRYRRTSSRTCSPCCGRR